MLTIGFTTVFYTLWEVNTYNVLERGKWITRTEHQYFRNLSRDLDAAKAKVAALGAEVQYDVNLGLRGASWFVIDVPIEEKEVKAAKDYTFTFGRMKGQDIRTAGDYITEGRAIFDEGVNAGTIAVYDYTIGQRNAQDDKGWKDVVWQLNRAMKSESTSRRRVYARRRLIDLGELVRRDWMEKVPVQETISDEYADTPIKFKEVKRKWMPKGLAKWHDEIGSKKGLFYNDGERLTLTLTEIKHKMLPSDYGTLHIVNYVDNNGNLVTYKGGTPPVNKVVTVKATIKHNRNETYIQRLKTLANNCSVS